MSGFSRLPALIDLTTRLYECLGSKELGTIFNLLNSTQNLSYLQISLSNFSHSKGL